MNITVQLDQDQIEDLQRLAKRWGFISIESVCARILNTAIMEAKDLGAICDEEGDENEE